MNIFESASGDSAENRLKKTLFVVEATSFERFELWCDHAKESKTKPNNTTPRNWTQPETHGESRHAGK